MEASPSVSEAWPDWEPGWDGQERMQMRRMAKMTFAEKLGWLDGANQLVAEMLEQRRKAGMPVASKE